MTIRYVAVGDSFSEGMGDDAPDGRLRGWADRVAEGLATARAEVIGYANLAIRGRRISPIVEDQLDAALKLDPKPTLLTISGGGNDILRPSFDPQRITAHLEIATDRCTAAGVRVVLLSPPDPSAQLPLGGLIHERGRILAEASARLADRKGISFVNVSLDTRLRDAAYWSTDRLHLNATGHAHVAARVLEQLGVPVDPTEVPVASGRGRGRGLGRELRYYREYVLPWIGRRLRGRSSGDGRTAKLPTWTPVPPIIGLG